MQQLNCPVKVIHIHIEETPQILLESEAGQLV